MRKAVLLSFVTCGLLTATAYSAVEYEVTDLSELWQSSLPYYTDEFFMEPWHANGINDRGQIVGYVNAYNSNYAFIWDESNGLRDLGNLGRSNSAAYAINNSGQVVGFSGTSMVVDGLNHPFLWSESSGMQSLGLLYLDNACALDISDNGIVVGRCGYGYASFIWKEEEGLRELEGLGGIETEARAVNNHGQAVGYSFPENSNLLACLWENGGEVQVLPGLDSNISTLGLSRAYDINNNGDIVGYAKMSDENNVRALLWRGGEAHDLGSLGSDNAYAIAINENRDVIGDCEIYEDTRICSHVFIWNEKQGIRDVNDLISTETDLRISYAIDINDNGWILAKATSDEFESTHIVLLRPVPEPGMSVFVLIAAMCMCIASVGHQLAEDRVGGGVDCGVG